MRIRVLSSVALLPLLLTLCQAAQDWSLEQPDHPTVFFSDEGGSTSYLGVGVQEVTADRLGTLKLKEEKGVEVTVVDEETPAGKAGIQEHDVILTLNGTPVESTAALKRMIRETPPGRTVTLGISRYGQPLTIKVKLADKGKEYASGKSNGFYFEMPKMPDMPDIEIPSMNMVVVTQSARSGLTVENISGQLAEYFGARNGNGVLVRSVEKGSRADKAGFHAGDVIVKINDQPVHDTSDFTHGLRSGNTANVLVIREKHEQSITLPLPERKSSGELLREESSQTCDYAKSIANLAKMREQFARIRPQLTASLENQSRQAIEQLNRAYRDQERQLRDWTEQQQRQLRKEQEDFEKQRQKMRNHLDQLRRQMRDRTLDI
jgi:serine protease Do